MFLTQGKTNWKYILIVVVLAVIVGGIVWYCYLRLPESKPSTTELPKLENKVTITTDKKEYELGETIGIIIKNNSSIENFIDYPIVESLVNNEWAPIKGSIVWTGCWVPSGLVYLPLEPNTLNSYQWDQKEKWCSSDSKDLNTYSKEVLSGTYRVQSRMIARIKSEAEDPNNISGQPAEMIYSNEFIIKETGETADWKIYRNEEIGFEFQYPKVYDEEKHREVCGIKEFDEHFTVGSLVSLWIEDSKGLNLSEYVDKDTNEFMEMFSAFNIESEEGISISGEKAVKVSYGSYNQRAYLLKNGEIYKFNIFNIEGPKCEFRYGPDESKYISEIEVFNQMLSTFRFLK